jgi:hypothetical protein
MVEGTCMQILNGEREQEGGISYPIATVANPNKLITIPPTIAVWRHSLK